MKRSSWWAIFVVTVFFVSALCLSAEAADSGVQPPSSPVYLTIGGGTLGGTTYVQATAIAKIVNAHIPNVNMTAEPGSGLSNIRDVNNGVFDMAGGQPESLFWGYEGREYFDGQKTPDNRMLFPGSKVVFHPLVLPDSPIKTMYDLKGKKVGVGAARSAEIMFEELYKDYGYDYANDIAAQIMGHQNAVDMVKDGQIDMANPAGGLPAAAVVDAIMTKNCRIVPQDPEVLKKVQQRIPYFFPTVIPAGTYANHDEDIPAYAAGGVFYVNKTMSDDLAYLITKAVFENMDEMIAVHVSCEEFNFENSVQQIKDGLFDGIPFHRGAARYYKERGFDVYTIDAADTVDTVD